MMGIETCPSIGISKNDPGISKNDPRLITSEYSEGE
jgi:hypothetical protein